MNQRRYRSRGTGQAFIEYAAAIVIVTAALVSMAIYMKRAVSGKLRAGADAIGEQYHPRQTSSGLTYSVRGTTKISSQMLLDVPMPNGTRANVMETTTDIDETSDRTGTENVGAMGGSLWQ